MPERTRLKGIEREATINIAAATLLLEQADGALKSRLTDAGAHESLETVLKTLQKVQEALTDTIDKQQLLSILCELKLCEVRVVRRNSIRPPEMILLDYEMLDPVASTLLRDTCALCDKQRSEARYCPVKKLLDEIPMIYNQNDDVTWCPYATPTKS